MEIRQRVFDFVAEGHPHRAAAQFRVSIKFVKDMVLLQRATGALEPKPQGNCGWHGKLAGVASWRGLRAGGLDRAPDQGKARPDA